jgi:hypothetical protein
VTVRREGLDLLAVHRVTHGPGTAGDFWKRGERVAAAARGLVGSGRGVLRRDLHVERLPAPFFPGVRVGSHLRHALPHHEGHGVIRPVRAKVLRFTVHGRVVFTMRVGPVPPNRYLVKALRAARR